MKKQKTPFFSIVIPVKSNPNIECLNKSLKALKKQTFTDFEIILVLNSSTYKDIYSIIKSQTELKTVIGNWKKSEARNIGSRNAAGKYLIHLDIDNMLFKNSLKEASELVKRKKLKTLILSEIIYRPKTIWQKARQLERVIALDDSTMSSPQIIENKLFQNIGGFDIRTDGLDDWSLALKLLKNNINSVNLKNATAVFEPTNLFDIFKHRLYKGRFLKPLINIYKNVPQISMRERMKVYLKQKKILLNKPKIFIALILLKLLDYIPFYIGMFFPIQVTISQSSIYDILKIAENFDKENMITLSAKYKDFQEKNVLQKVLSRYNTKDTILELGAGTGRITNFLTRLGYKVIPTDVSPAMLKVLKSKKFLPKPLLINNSSHLPFKDKSFGHTIAIRVIWHIMDAKSREDFFREAVRSAKNTIVMDFTSKKYDFPFIKPIIKLISVDFFDNTYSYSYKEIELLSHKYSLNITNVYKLEILPVFPLNIPNKYFFKYCRIYAWIEDKFSIIMPPGRYLIEFTKNK